MRPPPRDIYGGGRDPIKNQRDYPSVPARSNDEAHGRELYYIEGW